MAITYAYKFDGPNPVHFRDQVLQPGDSYESEEPILHGNFTPKNDAAKARRAEDEGTAPAAAARPKAVAKPKSAAKKKAAPAAQPAAAAAETPAPAAGQEG